MGIWISATVFALNITVVHMCWFQKMYVKRKRRGERGLEEGGGHNGKTQLHVLCDLTLARGEGCSVFHLVVM